MPKENIDELIQQLRDLQLQQDAIINRIAQAKQELEEENDDAQDSWRPTGSYDWAVGDKVKITNKVTVPGFRRPTEANRLAHITKIIKTPFKTQVHFTTISELKCRQIDSNLLWMNRPKRK